MSVMGFQKKKFGWGGWGELYPSFFLDFLNFFNRLCKEKKIPKIRVY